MFLPVLVVLPIIKQEETMNWHPSGVTRTRIRVIGVNFSEILIKGKDSDSSSQPRECACNRLKVAENTRVRLKVLLVFSVTRSLFFTLVHNEEVLFTQKCSR